MFDLKEVVFLENFGERDKKLIEGVRMSSGAAADAVDIEKAAESFPRVWLFTLAAMSWTWIVGAYGLSLFWLTMPILILWLIWKEQTRLVVVQLANEVNNRLHRQRAFRQAESAEWLNALINRW